MAFAAIAPAVISAGASLIGNSMTQSGNAKAARLQMIANAQAQQKREAGLVEQRDILTGAQADQLAQLDWGFDGSYDAIMAAAADAADNLTRGAGAATDAYRTGEFESSAELRRIQNTNAPGMVMLRELVGNPQALTPAQRKAIEDSRRVVGENIRGSSIAGSGRTAAALLKEVEADQVLKAQEQNRQQAIAAATLMANADNAAAGRIATNKTTLGDKIGSTQMTLGQNLAQNASEAGGRLSSIYGDTGARKAGVIGGTAGQISNAIGATFGANANTDESTGKAQANAATASASSASQTAGAVGAAIADALRGSKYNTASKANTTATGGTSSDWW